MSVQATTWVWEHTPDVSGSPLLVLLAIADGANREGEASCQAVSTLVKMTRLSESTVHRAVKWLIANGYIESLGQSPRYNYTHIYRLPRMGGCQSDTGGVSSATNRGVTDDTRPQKTYPNKNASAAAEAPRRSTQALVGRWVEGAEGGGLDRPPDHHIKKFGTHAAALVKELTKRNGTLGKCPDGEWQRALDTAYFLGAKGVYPMVSAYFGENGTPPDLPPDGQYVLYESGGVALW